MSGLTLPRRFTTALNRIWQKLAHRQRMLAKALNCFMAMLIATTTTLMLITILQLVWLQVVWSGR
jgi:hypothetical protein